jgi:HD-GYP domain-containing protein (c-di-GMP phosphodiesterase class II)
MFFTSDIETLSSLQTTKGWLFILITAVLLYLLIEHDFSAIKRAQQELLQSNKATLESWMRALDMRDKETEGHTQRVTDLALRLARAMGMNEVELEDMRRGSLMHDFGKMAVPDRILLKAGILDEDELKIMRRHPVSAHEFLSPITHLHPALDIPYSHHEKWDGTGYPLGMKGEQIPMAARIFAVIDVYDALRSDRPYRPAWPEEKVREYIIANSGKHFDPHVVEVFMRLI